MKFTDAVILRLEDMSKQENNADIRPYLDKYVLLAPEIFSTLYVYLDKIGGVNPEDIAERFVNNLCKRLREIEEKKHNLYYCVYQSDELPLVEKTILECFLFGEDYHASIGLLVDEMRKIRSIVKVKLKKPESRKGLCKLRKMRITPTKGNSGNNENEDKNTILKQLISPYQANAFTPYVLHQVTNQALGFYVPDKLWENINDAFEYYWNVEVDMGGYFNIESMFQSVRSGLIENHILFPDDLLYKAVSAIVYFMDEIPGVIIHD
jgi:hypothetical protein